MSRASHLDMLSPVFAPWVRPSRGLMACLLALSWLPASAQTRVASPTLQVPRVNAPTKIDDYLGAEPHPGLAVTDFRQREPKDLEPATERTTAYLSYDNTSIYVAFVCEASNPAQVRARMAKREAMFSDDFVGIMLDTFRDQQRAYLFFVNPLGIQADGVTSAGSGDDYSFDTQWSSDGKLTSTGYVVWMAIPFKSLRFPVMGSGMQRWGVALIRAIPAKDENDFWPAITRKLSGFVSQFGVMEGLTGVSPGRNIQLTPYGTFAGARFLDVPASRYTSQTEHRVGLDAKAVVHDALTLDFALNPDFSQVESDDPQVTVNQRFEVFFPEKRPFFLENADYFTDTPQTLFFSRRVSDPQFGARATGKIGHWAMGAFVADDRAPGRQVDPASAASGDRTVDSVFRARDDFGHQSRVGVLVTNRTFGPSSNTVASADARIRLTDKWFVDSQVSRSTNTAVDGESSSGTSVQADLSRSGRAFSYTLTYVDASPTFKTQLGFVPRLDYRQLTDFFTMRWFPKKGPVIDFGPNSFAQATWSYDGALRDWLVRLPFEVDFKGQTYLFGRHAFISETINGTAFREREDLVQFGSDHFKKAGVNLSFGHGTRPNYYPAAGLTPFLGDFTDISAGLTLRPASAVRVDETYLYSRLVARADSPGHGTIFSNPILRSRVSYQFSREWSLRAILDYRRLTPEPGLVALDRQRHGGVDLLLTWLPHPGTALYIGYTDGYDNVRLDPVDGAVPTASALSSTGRQVFVKTSWLFRF